MKRIVIIILMFLLIQTGYGELLTRPEIESVLDSKVILAPEQKRVVVDLMVEMLRVVEEEYAKTEDEVVQLHEEEVAAMLKQFKMDYNVLEGDRNIWRTVAFIEGGALVAVIVYAILK